MAGDTPLWWTAFVNPVGWASSEHPVPCEALNDAGNQAKNRMGTKKNKQRLTIMIVPKTYPSMKTGLKRKTAR